jgi:hypothetical protein
MDPGPASLKCSARPQVTWRAVRYALKHLVDEGKISSYSDRPPDVYYIKATVHAAPMPINEAMENDWVAFQKNRY